VFIYALLQAFAGADANGNGTIEVTELASFVDDKVPELSYEAFRQRQVPQMKIVGSNFAVSARAAMLPNTSREAEVFPTKPTHVVIAPTDVSLPRRLAEHRSSGLDRGPPSHSSARSRAGCWLPRTVSCSAMSGKQASLRSTKISKPS
jgi:hypothetical protein